MGEEKKRRVNLLKIQGYSRDELKDFKSSYHVQNCNGVKKKQEDILSTDKKFVTMARASK